VCRAPVRICHHRRPPPLDPLDRLGADELDGRDVDEDGRVVPCEGVSGRVVVWLPPVLVDGLVWVDVLAPLLLEPVDGLLCDGATASDGLVLLPVLGPEPVTPVDPLGRVEPCPGVDGRCWVTVWPLRLLEGGSATR
jgi:hypothetical protein